METPRSSVQGLSPSTGSLADLHEHPQGNKPRDNDDDQGPRHIRSVRDVISQRRHCVRSAHFALLLCLGWWRTRIGNHHAPGCTHGLAIASTDL